MISAVFLPSRTATKMVLSPAMDPAISGHFRESMASPATEALPEMVLMTIRFPALVMDTTQLENRRMNRSCRSDSAFSTVAYL